MSSPAENTTDRFWIQPPVGYAAEKMCTVGHPILFKHIQLGTTYTPLMLNGSLACSICVAIQTGVVCARSHMSFEVGNSGS